MKNGLMRENALHFRHPHYQRYDYSLMKKAIQSTRNNSSTSTKRKDG